MSFDFSRLNLAGVDAQRGSTTLKPGRFACSTGGAEIRSTANGGKQVAIKLTDLGGQGSVTDYITVAHMKAATDEKAAMSVRIGLERLKALLVYGGHPTPDTPGDVKSLNGLVVGVNVEQGEDWVDDRGVTRKGGGKPRKSGAYFRASELGIAATAAQASDTPKSHGDIPF